MFSYIWPIALAVLANVAYHICCKSAPEGMNPLASLSFVYFVGAVVSLGLFFLLGRGSSLLGEYRKLNWASVALGVSIVGLEVGFLYAYRVGWPVSTAAIVQSAFLSIALLAVGFGLYREPLSWNKVVGAVICLVGLAVINYK